jgi:hypothetical protein
MIMRSKQKTTATKESFCASFPWTIAIQWFDLTGMYKYGDGERVARIDLSTNGAADLYVGFRVTVLNTRKGKIDEKFFAFNDYLSERADDRSDYKGGFEVYPGCGWGWYIAVPKTTEPLVRAIEQYLMVFQ